MNTMMNVVSALIPRPAGIAAGVAVGIITAACTAVMSMFMLTPATFVLCVALAVSVVTMVFTQLAALVA